MGEEMRTRLYQTGDFKTGELDIATPHELFEAWCNYIGLVHCADSILTALSACGYKIELPTTETEN